MKYTLLELVQLILAAMDSDEVDSISDTVESNQVALLLKALYYDMAVELGLPEHETMFQLDASGDVTKPVLMTVPENVTNMHWVNYDIKLTEETHVNYREVEFRPFLDFLRHTQQLREETEDVGEMAVENNGEEFTLLHREDTHPRFYTSTDDHTLIFDAFNSDEDSTLQKSKTLCHGSVWSTFQLDDSFTPDLDPTQFSYYINRAKVRAFAELKQTAHDEAAGESRNQKVVLQKRKRKVPNVPEIRRAPNYGRKRFIR